MAILIRANILFIINQLSKIEGDNHVLKYYSNLFNFYWASITNEYKVQLRRHHRLSKKVKYKTLEVKHHLKKIQLKSPY